jgi:hypothetical protein
MVPRAWYNVHTSAIVPGGLEVVDRSHSTHWIHPVMLAVYEEPQRGVTAKDMARVTYK